MLLLAFIRVIKVIFNPVIRFDWTKIIIVSVVNMIQGWEFIKENKKVR